MIVRIVQMTFQPDKLEEFKTIFEEGKQTIKRFAGCQHVEMLQDVNNENIFFTYSHWDSEADLNNYRNSDFFRITWQNTKVLFAAKPQAWSLAQRSKAV